VVSEIPLEATVGESMGEGRRKKRNWTMSDGSVKSTPGESWETKNLSPKRYKREEQQLQV